MLFCGKNYNFASRNTDYLIMTSFLKLVAQDLHSRLGGDFSRTVVVFPNKRASLFLNEYLLEASGGVPVWAPRYVTINQLFASFMPQMGVNDPIDTVLRIVMLFRTLTDNPNVSVDWFYGWAERILSDFDDVDKNMADADLLFRNINDLKSFDGMGFLTEKQVADLQQFFKDFDPERKSELRERYRQLWEVLGELYHQLNQELASENLAYEGALFRKVVEGIKNGEVTTDPHVDHYVMVGFNVLDRVEEELFKALKEKGKAWFYWDYDTYYCSEENNHEAGLFLYENIHNFPNAISKENFDNLQHDKELNMVSASTEAIQAQYVAPWVETYLTKEDAKRTAIVLCNENLVQPVLHGLPDNVTDLNVTKGFPLSHTEVATFVEHTISEWERRATTKNIVELLAELTAKVEAEGRAYVNREGYDKKKFEYVLQGEAYYLMFTILNRFTRIMERYPQEQQMTLVILRRLVRNVVRQSSIPFHGEPAVGLQVMGVLETRCLDFDHVLMLSVNDGKLPQRANDNSFIPYLLRKAFKLTTPERKVAVYAYYFYRLLQRASHVTMIYNTSTEGVASGEMSRFMTQLMVEWPGTIKHYSLNSSQQSVHVEHPSFITKPADMIERLKIDRKGNIRKLPVLSPSSLRTYLDCQLKFYYQTVMGISEPKAPKEEIKPNVFGDLFHKAAELVYQDYIGKGGHVDARSLRFLADNHAALQTFVRKAFEEQGVEYKLLEARVIEIYLRTLLLRDAEMGEFEIVAVELRGTCSVELTNSDSPLEVGISGIIDRIDFLPNGPAGATLRILDYKTGSTTVKSNGEVEDAVAKSVEDLFSVGGKKSYMLQTFLYDLMLPSLAQLENRVKQFVQYPVTPALFYVKKASKKGYDPRLKINGEYVNNLSDFSEEFREHLQRLLSEIFDISHPFVAPEHKTAKDCAKCPYFSICYHPHA